MIPAFSEWAIPSCMIAALVLTVSIHLLARLWWGGERRRRWRQIGRRLGLRQIDAPQAALEPFRGLPSLQEGGLSLQWGVTGRVGAMEVVLGDFTEELGEVTHWTTAGLVRADGVHLPRCVVRPATLVDRIGKLFCRLPEVRFEEEDEVFSRRYVLLSTDEPDARNLFTVGLRSWLIAGKDACRLETAANTFLFHHDALAEGEAAAGVLEEAQQLLVLLSAERE